MTVAHAPVTFDAKPAARPERRPPVILIATANEAQGARYLRSLASELEDVVAALDTAQREGVCEVVTLCEATADQIVAVFQSDAYRDRVAVLHFAGHAGPQGLLLETDDGDTAVADAGGLAGFLGCQRGLQLVVLNACATNPHVDALRTAGVGAVIATSRSVQDAIAHEFAVMLYQGLGSGAGIRRAYDEAASGVRFKYAAVATGTTAESMHASAMAVSRDIRREPPAPVLLSADGRWPWDIYFRAGAEDTVGPWNLPDAAGNPLFGLPPLPETTAPLTEPFRHLRPFSREHAELFFGRGKDIRELYDKVTSTASEPVLLLYGATGVGKSSLLDAGLLPRLTSEYEVRYTVRDRSLELLGTLAHAVDPAADDLSDAQLADAWRKQEEYVGRPLLVVLDQVEQAFTTEDAGQAAVGDAARELDAFARAIGALFENDATRPRGRLVLGLRKEWLADVRSALTSHRVPRSEHHLDQLTRDGVIEAITGPTRLAVHRMPARLDVQLGLEVLIADDLLAKRASHVAPLLQILLAEMWAEAPRHDTVVRFDKGLYEQVQSNAKQLDEFLSRQLAALRTWHAPTVDSGLALDFLRFYTTSKATADEHTFAEEATRYPHASEPSPGLRAMCVRLFLLVERTADETGASSSERPARLAHDTLAPIVRERFDRSDLPGPRAKRILDGRSAEWSGGHVGIPLDAQDLGVVERGERGMRVWTDDEQRLVQASRIARDRARRRRTWALRGAAAAITAIVGFGVGSWMLYTQSQTRLAESQSRELGVRALTTDASRRDVGLLFGVASYDRAPTFEARRSLFSQLARDPHLVRVAATSASTIVFTPDASGLVQLAPDGIRLLDIATGRDSLLVPISVDRAEKETVVLDEGGATYSAVAARDTVANVVHIGVWEIPSGRRVGLIPASVPDAKRQVSWYVGPPGPNDARVVAVSTGDGVLLYDVASGRVGHRLRGHTPNYLLDEPIVGTFSRDGSVLITTGSDRRAIAWDVATARRLRTATLSRNRVAGAAVSRDNTVMAVMDDDALVFWPLRSSAPPRRITATDYYRPDFHAMTFAAGDSLFVGAGERSEILVFAEPLAEFSMIGPLRTLHAAGAVQATVAASATGYRIATLGLDGLVHVWDLEASPLIRSMGMPIELGTEIEAMSPNAKFAVARSQAKLTIWDVEAPRPLRDFEFRRPGMDPSPTSATMFADSGRLLLGPGGHLATRGHRPVFETGTAMYERTTAAPPRADVVADPARARIAYGIPGTHTVVVAQLAQPGRADTLVHDAVHASMVDSTALPVLAFSPRGDLLAVQSTSTFVLVWDLARRQVRDSLSGTNVLASQIALSDDGRTIIAADGDRILFWRTGTVSPYAQLRWPFAAPPIALSPDGSLVAMSGGEAITLVDAQRGSPLGDVPTGEVGFVAMTFTDGGRSLVAVGYQGEVVRIATNAEAWADQACAIAASDAALARWAQDAPLGARPPARCLGPGRRR